MPDQNLESATEACQRLKVSSQTLYAYVSRGLVRTSNHPEDSRKRLYWSLDIDQLIKRQTRGRSRSAVAQSTIDFGEPILRSKITRIQDGEFYYRGQNAVQLSRTASLESVFELLCGVTINNSRNLDKSSFISDKPTPLARFIEALSNQVISGCPRGNKHHAYQLLMLLAQNAAQTGRRNQHEAIHELLARAWSTDKRAPDLIRRALVLSADHELNASAYAARVCASAGASLPSCLLTGVLTLSGNKHGGLTDLSLAWLRSLVDKSSPQKALDEFSTKCPPPGFGHRLYPHGDPRATEITAHCAPPQAWVRVAKKIVKQTGAHPTLDFALATLEHQLKLPKGAGFSIFAVGRTVGWLAHCFEQRRQGSLIRPRASL